MPRPQDGDGDGVPRCDIGAFEQQTSSGGGAGPATHFVLSAPATATTGSPVTFTVTALDASDVTATGYAGTIHFTSTDAGATLAADATLSNGAATFSATLQTSGSQTIMATDVASDNHGYVERHHRHRPSACTAGDCEGVRSGVD